jgi:hypothetical protein
VAKIMEQIMEHLVLKEEKDDEEEELKSTVVDEEEEELDAGDSLVFNCLDKILIS